MSRQQRKRKQGRSKPSFHWSANSRPKQVNSHKMRNPPPEYVAKRRHFHLPQPTFSLLSISSLNCQIDMPKLCLFSPTFLCLALVSMLLVPLSEALKKAFSPTNHRHNAGNCRASARATRRPFSCPRLDVSNFIITCANLCPFLFFILCHNAGMIPCACLCQPDANVCAQLAVCNPCPSSQLY